jgi:hypothetical protein
MGQRQYLRVPCQALNHASLHELLAFLLFVDGKVLNVADNEEWFVQHASLAMKPSER